MSKAPNLTQRTGGDLGYLPTYNANSSVFPLITDASAVTDITALNGLTWSPFAYLSEFNFSLGFDDEEEVRAINCGEELFLSTATKFATVGGTILQNNDQDSLSYLLGGGRITDVVSPQRTDEIWNNQLGTFLKPKTAFRFVSCDYEVVSDPDNLTWRRDYIYIADAVIEGSIESAYKSGTESFEGITFELKSSSKNFVHLYRRGATQADLG